MPTSLPVIIRFAGLFVDALKDIGVKENNIIVWDQYQHHLQSSGFRLNMSFKGVRAFATDRGGGQKALDSGSSHKEYDSGYGAVRISRIWTEEVDSVINLGLLKDHSIAGVTIALKNISHGVVSHPEIFHDDSCDPFIAAINSIPIIKDKICMKRGTDFQKFSFECKKRMKRKKRFRNFNSQDVVFVQI